MGDADDGRLLHRGVTHQGVFQVNRADPFSTGLHQILGTIDQLDIALVIHRRDVAGLEPAVFGPAVGLVGRIVIAAGNPGAADCKFAGSLTVARSFDHATGSTLLALRTPDPQFDEGTGPALLAAYVVTIVFGPVAHVGFQEAEGGERRRLGHAPQVHDVKIVLVERAHEANGRSGASAKETDGRSNGPTTGIVFQSG